MFSLSLILCYVVLVFFLSILFKKFYPKNKELLRKIIHIGMGPLIPISKLLEIEQHTALYFTGFITLLIIINYVYKFVPLIEDIDRRSFGTLFYCLSLFILITIFWEKDPSALIVGYFIMAFGDGLAGLIGKNIKSKNWKVFNQKKSILGTLTMFGVSILVVSFVNYTKDINLYYSYLLIACVSTLLEQISVIGIDNFTVPIVSSFLFNYLITNN